MLNIGAGEIAVILVVALLVLGPKRLPELARVVGKFVREFRRQTDEVRTTLETEFYRMDQDLLKEEIKPIPQYDASGQLPAITGPLDGGRRVADELDAAHPNPHGAEGHGEHDSGHGEHGQGDSGHADHGHGAHGYDDHAHEPYGHDAHGHDGHSHSEQGDDQHPVHGHGVSGDHATAVANPASQHRPHVDANRVTGPAAQTAGQVISLDAAPAVTTGVGAHRPGDDETAAAAQGPRATGTDGGKDGHS